MNSWKVILASLVIFGAGVVTGGLLVNHVNHFHPREVFRPPPDIPIPRSIAEHGSKQFIQQLTDKLQLTPAQKDKIQKIIADGQDRNHCIWTNVAPKMRDVIQDVNKQIREQLTPAQQEQFEEILRHPPRKSNATNAPPNLSTTNSLAAPNAPAA